MLILKLPSVCNTLPLKTTCFVGCASKRKKSQPVLLFYLNLDEETPSRTLLDVLLFNLSSAENSFIHLFGALCPFWTSCHKIAKQSTLTAYKNFKETHKHFIHWSAESQTHRHMER